MGTALPSCLSAKQKDPDSQNRPKMEKAQQKPESSNRNRNLKLEDNYFSNQIEFNLNEVNISEQQQLEIIMAIESSLALNKNSHILSSNYFSLPNPQNFSQKLDYANYSPSIIADIQGQSQWVRIQQQYILEKMKKTGQFIQNAGQFIQQGRTSKIKDRNKRQCPICFGKIEMKNMVILKCLHCFDNQCIKQHIKACVQANQLKIKCPTEKCKELINVSDIQSFGDSQTVRKYYQMTFRQYIAMNHKDTSWCPTPNCTAVFVYDNQSSYSCNVCTKRYCLKCKSNFHIGMTCAQFRLNNARKEDQKFEQFAKGAKYKKCQSCNFWVQKSQGCDHMVCRCGNHFCYKCGQKYPHGGNCKSSLI